MRRTKLLLFAGLTLALAAAVAAQGPTDKIGPRFDPATVESLEGTVEEVKLLSFGRGRMGGGVHLMVNTGEETLEVHLGPRFYLEDNDFEIETGEEVEVTGSRVTLAGQPALLAREIRVGEYKLELRAQDGTPLWAGGAQAGRSMGPRHVRGRHGACHHCGCGQCGGCGTRCCQ